MQKVREIGTPMSLIIKLDNDEKGKDMNQKLYRGMIALLLYLTASWPDIMFNVCLCARFQACPKDPTWLHLNVSLDILLKLKT